MSGCCCGQCDALSPEGESLKASDVERAALLVPEIIALCRKYSPKLVVSWIKVGHRAYLKRKAPKLGDGKKAKARRKLKNLSEGDFKELAKKLRKQRLSGEK